MAALHWSLWIALAALLAGAGKFLDDYHISKQSKSVARDALTRWFIWLDEQVVPDLGAPILAAVSRILSARRLWLILAGLSIAYLSTTTAFYVGREFFGPANTQGYVEYVLSWLFIDDRVTFWLVYFLALAIPAIGGLAFIAYCFHRAAQTRGAAKRLAFLLIGVIGSAIICSSASLIIILIGGVSAYGPPVLAMASVSSILAPSLFAILTAVLMLSRVFVRGVQLILLRLFDVASNPEKSPYTYASSLVSLFILLLKLAQELITVIN